MMDGYRGDKPTDLVGLHFYAADSLSMIHYELTRLATAFRITGNITVAEQLSFLADETLQAKDDFYSAFSSMQAGSLQMAKQGTANLLAVALKMADMEAKS